MVFQIGEAVAEAEASLPEIVVVLPAGTNAQGVQQAVQGFINTALMAVSERK